MLSLRSFHHRCVCFITGNHIREIPDGSWSSCPENATVLEKAGLWTIDKYIRQGRRTVMYYAMKRLIYRANQMAATLPSSFNQPSWTNISRDDA